MKPLFRGVLFAYTPESRKCIRGSLMDRRAFLKSMAGAGALGTASGLATPAISQRAAARSLRFVPQADLANFDPIWGTQYVVRNASVMVWDTLYGVDENLQPQRQMVEGEEASADGLTWTFRLRPGLKFHDGTPVLARDVVASLNRWAARDHIALVVEGAGLMDCHLYRQAGRLILHPVNVTNAGAWRATGDNFPGRGCAAREQQVRRHQTAAADLDHAHWLRRSRELPAYRG